MEAEQTEWRPDQSPWQMPLSPVSLAGTHIDAIYSLFRDDKFRAESRSLAGRGNDAVALDDSSTNEDPFVGVREYLSKSEGQGYWELFEIDPHLYLTVTDAKYVRPVNVLANEDGMLKLRLLLRGSMLDKDSRKLIMSGPAASLTAIPPDTNSGYLLGDDERVELIILHFYPDALFQNLGITKADLPQAMRTMLDAMGRECMQRKIRLTPEIAHCATDVLNFRANFAKPLRHSFLRMKCYEILCMLVQLLLDEEHSPLRSSSMSEHDVRRIYEARELLMKNFAEPPSIPALSRAIGINRTKTKSGFKEIFGRTIYEYIIKLRMERARELLLKGDRPISWISEEVGYAYPANFTHAFKRYYGYLPKSIR
jgi:AraC family transcriptional regulator, transcriptional activator of the genes for pyochelin and ferripyochelin receptors